MADSAFGSQEFKTILALGPLNSTKTLEYNQEKKKIQQSKKKEEKNQEGIL